MDGWCRRSFFQCVLVIASLAAGCGGGQPTASSGESATTNPPAGETAPAAPAKSTVPTVTVPDDPCGWVPVSDIEAAIGPLAGPPTAENGCRYTLQMPEEIAAKRRKAAEVQQKLAQMGATLGGGSGALGDADQGAATYAIVVSIDSSGSVAAELGIGGAHQAGDGWDRKLPVPYGFGGRAGHLTIIAEGQAPDVPRDQSHALAALYRDRIPDLPFPSLQQQQADGPDPCGLLTREAAEAVLGTLVVAPYRSTAGSPLADPGGASCAYFTKGHHVLVLTPTWTGGQQEYQTGRVFGAMVGSATGKQAQKIDGPWDHAQVGSLTGGLGVLKGDKLLQIDFLTSSTDRAGAIELAKQAVANL